MQGERQGITDEKKYICGNDFGHNRGNLICIGDVHGDDSRVECIFAGSTHGRRRNGSAAHHGAGLEKDGKEGADQTVGKNCGGHPHGHSGCIAAGCGNVLYHGMEQHDSGDCDWNHRDCNFAWLASFCKRIKVKMPCLNLGEKLLLYATAVSFAALSLIDTASGVLPYFAGILIYVLAACTLSASCYYLVVDIRYEIKEKVNPGMKANPFTSRITEDYRYRTVVFAVPGLILNLIFAVFNGVLGIAGHSAWFATLSTYYTLLSVMRFHAVMHDRRASKTEPSAEVMLKEIEVYRNCGILFMVMTATLAGTVILLMESKGQKYYPGVAIFAVAAYTFYKTIISIINVVKAEKLKAPLLMAIRDIGYIDASVSVLSLQTAMFASFGEGRPGFERLMNGLTGAVICLMALAMGVRCVRTSLRMKKELLEGGNVCGSYTCSGR